jgi:hypothetical protein
MAAPLGALDRGALPTTLDEVAEAVPDSDLRDLAQPAEIPLLLGPRRHAQSVARSCEAARAVVRWGS